MANYKTNPGNSFFAFEDDIDDEKFLKNSRNSSYSGHSNFTSPQNSFDNTKNQLLERKKAIEDQTLASTERSLCLLRESEETGIATAEELYRQREQLEKADKNLDTINSTLRTTQRKIDGIRSVFGSFKNYLTKKSDPLGGTSKSSGITPIDRKSFSSEKKISDIPESVHPGLTLRGLGDEPTSSLSVSDRIDQNLDMICGTVSTLKSLALKMGDEIEYQNDLIEDITYKADKAEITINKQTKEMNRLANCKMMLLDMNNLSNTRLMAFEGNSCIHKTQLSDFEFSTLYWSAGKRIISLSIKTDKLLTLDIKSLSHYVEILQVCNYET